MEPFELAREKFRLAKKMEFDRESIEIATPEIIANYRAKRLACNIILDIGCGLGGDTIALAGACGKVIAIDIDQRRIKFAQKNCEVYGRKNVQFFRGDAPSIDLEKFGATYAFADPTRRVEGRRIKELSKTFPSTTKLIKKLSSFKGYCVEASQQLNPEEIPYDCECEYISLDNELVCLSLYFGELKKCKRSAVVLPANARLESKQNVEKTMNSPLKKYFYEIDPAIVKAGLIPELASMLNLPIHDNFLTSEETVTSPFFKNSFELLMATDEDNLIQTLKSLDAKKVVLRGRLDPDQQLEIKRDIESELSGTKKLHVFFKEKIIIARCLGIISK